MKLAHGLAVFSLGLASLAGVSLYAGNSAAPAGCCGGYGKGGGTTCPATQSAAASAGAPVLLLDVAATATAPAKGVEVGNTKCPVLGDAVDKEVSTTYQGKVYHFCCSGCIPEFNKDPEKFIKLMAADPAKYGLKK